MLGTLDIATIYTCLFLSLLVAVSTMATAWRSNFRQKAAGYWTLAYVFGIVAAVFLTLQTLLGPFVPALCTAVVLAANVAMLAGFRAFNGKTTPSVLFFILPGVYLVLADNFPVLYDNPNVNAMVQSLFVVVVALTNAHAILTGVGNRELPMAVPASVVLVVHAIVRGCVIYFTLFHPAPVINGRMEADWWKLFLLEIFFNTTMMAVSTIVLIKDRAEQRHRIASETDVLTGIANRRAFVKQINRLLPESEGGAVMAVMDIDHFKQINDTYGHEAGDKVLVDFARTVRCSLPSSALFGRLGGEEFAIYFPDDNADHGAVLDQVRYHVAETTFDYRGLPIRFSVSIGFASLETAGKHFDSLFAAADCAMYLAKKEGRNRVLAYKPSMRIREALDESFKDYAELPKLPMALKVI